MNCEIWHGDARIEARRINQAIQCIITDPPYGVGFKSNYAILPKGKTFATEIEGDADVDGAVLLFKEVMARLVPQLAEHADVYVFTRWNILQPWIDAVTSLGLKPTNCLVWDKQTPGLGDVVGSYGNSHEFIIYAKKGRRPVRERRSSILSVDRVDNKNHFHPTQKPVDLLEILIRQSTDPGELVVDPFCGSASTVLAAQNIGRRCIGIELEERYVNFGRERLSQTSLL